jgi:hypothetical protein
VDEGGCGGCVGGERVDEGAVVAWLEDGWGKGSAATAWLEETEEGRGKRVQRMRRARERRGGRVLDESP